MQLPLFPLNAVLFPDGLLNLRVFEARYIDMVADCLRLERGFGVCLASSGSAGSTAFDTIGCEARILTCDAPQPSLLTVRVLGHNRFRIQSTHTQENGLLIGDVEPIAADEDSPITPEHQPCAKLLARILLDLENQTVQKRKTDPAAEPPVRQPYQLNSSVWVSNRLCEVLQVPLKAKQKLMELEDAQARLGILTQYLRQHGVLS